jgi:hypothetical protein
MGFRTWHAGKTHFVQTAMQLNESGCIINADVPFEWITQARP